MEMDLGLKGKKAIVTGGTRGIGRAIASLLAAEGCDVAICARHKDAVEETVAALARAAKGPQQQLGQTHVTWDLGGVPGGGCCFRARRRSLPAQHAAASALSEVAERRRAATHQDRGWRWISGSEGKKRS